MTMSTLLSTVHQGSLTAGIAALIYTATVTATAVTAVLAPTPARRRAALDVLALLRTN